MANGKKGTRKGGKVCPQFAAVRLTFHLSKLNGEWQWEEEEDEEEEEKGFIASFLAFPAGQSIRLSTHGHTYTMPGDFVSLSSSAFPFVLTIFN